MNQQQQLVIVALGDREPLTGERYMLGEDGHGQVVTMLEPLTPDNLALPGSDPNAYGTVRIRDDQGTVRAVSTLGLGVLVVPAE